MSKPNRRSMLSLAATAPLMGMGATVPGGEVDAGTHGIMVRLAWGQAPGMKKSGWCVIVPDWDNRGVYWAPGHAVPMKWVALTQFLTEAEAEFLPSI